MNKLKLLAGLTAGTLLGMGAPAHAGSFFTSTITNGSNTYEDQSREAYIDVNGNGFFDAGDVLTGFLRLDNKTAPNALSLGNRIYAIFSQEVESISGTDVFFKPTTAPGLDLASLGVAGAGPNDMFAVFSNAGGFGTDLITTSPGDLTGNGSVTLKDYFRLIITGGVSPEMIGGRVDNLGGSFCVGGDTDCFHGTSTFAGGSNTTFATLTSSVSAGTFGAGLEVTLDPTGKPINDVTLAGPFPGPVFSISELAISGGVVFGGSDLVNFSEWADASELTGLSQCDNGAGGSVACGFADNANFVFNATVPEPGILALLGIGLFGLGFTRAKESRPA